MDKYIWATDAFDHATEVYPEECCGLIVNVDGVDIYWKCKNISEAYKEKSFVIDPLDWADCEDNVDEIHGIVHSHPEGEFRFSDNDIASLQLFRCAFLSCRTINTKYH